MPLAAQAPLSLQQPTDATRPVPYWLASAAFGCRSGALHVPTCCWVELAFLIRRRVKCSRR